MFKALQIGHYLWKFLQVVHTPIAKDSMNISQKRIKTQLIKLFEKEQVFKNTDLKITDVASKLHTNRTYISTLINSEYGSSFSSFVNQYRVEEAKRVYTGYKFYSEGHK